MKPLAGITVLELSTMITASLASMMLAEQGARVIKLEPLETGDPMRFLGARKSDVSALFANCNRGKESVRIDLKSAEAQALMLELIPNIDILIHNYRPGAMDGLNLDSATLRAINPQLIYCAISGFGTEGPLRRAPAYDPTIQAHAGYAATQGSDEEPAFFRSLLCDKITAYTACQAVTVALFARERTGEGQHIDLSMLDASLFFIFPDGFQNHTLLDDEHERAKLLIDFLYDLIQTRDGGVTISAGSLDMQRRLLGALGIAHILEDERFKSFEGLVRHRGEVFGHIREAALNYSSDELVALLQVAEVPCAKCLSREEVLAQEQVAANDTVATVEHPHLGSMRVVKTPARFGGERLSLASPAPRHGQHSESALASMGVSAERLQTLKAQGVIR